MIFGYLTPEDENIIVEYLYWKYGLHCSDAKEQYKIIIKVARQLGMYKKHLENKNREV